LKFQRSHSFSRAFADALKAKRLALGISHEKLAAASGVSRSAISMIEGGQRSASLVTCHALCEALGESVGSIAREAEVLTKGGKAAASTGPPRHYK
jgi:transcriptional regulator with XRE-family HTH domain